MNSSFCFILSMVSASGWRDWMEVVGSGCAVNNLDLECGGA